MKSKKHKLPQDKYLVKISIVEKKLLRKLSKLNKNVRLFYLGYFYCYNFYLYKNTVIISLCNADRDKNSNWNLKTLSIENCYTITLLKEYPKTFDDIEFKTIVENDSYTYPVKHFLEWIDRPCNLTQNIDQPFYKIITFLQKIHSYQFKSKNYLFYVKQDNDFSWCFNIYAKNLKTKKEMKLYYQAKYKTLENGFYEKRNPETIKDILVTAGSEDVTNYEKLKCRKEYLEYSKQIFPELEVTNHDILELLKQTIQPVKQWQEFGVYRIFGGRDNKFSNIWIPDFLKPNEEPYFFLTDDLIFKKANKMACINFKTATYHIEGDFIIGNFKYKSWILDKDYIKELVEYLKAPINLDNTHNTIYEKCATNWQKMIAEFNYNTAEISESEKLSLDLEMPDFIELLEDLEISQNK